MGVGGGGGTLPLVPFRRLLFSFFVAYVCLISVTRFSNSRETCRTYQTRPEKCCVVSLSIVWRWTTAEAIEHFYKITDSYRRKERSQLKEDTVKMTEVFKSHQECDNPRVVLIEGNPGMGKTTYCQKLAHDWSVGEIPPDASDIAFVEMPWHAHENR